MNDEYLWSKKGSDTEIESLEDLLSEFRFEHGDRREFLSQRTAAETGFFSKRLAWILGFAAPSFALALFGFWLFTSSPGADLEVRSANPGAQAREIRNDFRTEIPITISKDEPGNNVRAIRRKRVPVNVKTIYRSRKSKADRAGSLVAVRLTSEEKYAYDRLMLALSIAGTKLKVVQDAVDGNTAIRSGK